MLSEISQRNYIRFHLYVEPKIQKRNRFRYGKQTDGCQRGKGVRGGGHAKLVKGIKRYRPVVIK